MAAIEVRGLALDFDPDAINDVDVVDWLYTLESGEGFAPVKRLVVKFVGKEQWRSIESVLKDERGVVKADECMAFLNECFEVAGAKK